MCVNGTVYFNVHTQYGMYATHCIIWYLVETVELFNTLPIEISKFQNTQ